MKTKFIRTNTFVSPSSFSCVACMFSERWGQTWVRCTEQQCLSWRPQLSLWDRWEMRVCVWGGGVPLQAHCKCKGEKYLELVEGHATNTLHLGACQVYFFLPLTGGFTLPWNAIWSKRLPLAWGTITAWLKSAQACKAATANCSKQTYLASDSCMPWKRTWRDKVLMKSQRCFCKVKPRGSVGNASLYKDKDRWKEHKLISQTWTPRKKIDQKHAMGLC